MSCGAYSNHYATDLTQLIQNVVRRSPNYFESSDAAYSDIQLNLELFNKFAEANALDDALIRRREEFKLKTENLQKRKQTLHNKEVMLKERVISYEMYIKELAMKRERSLKRVQDEKLLTNEKNHEIETLKIRTHELKIKREKMQRIAANYQPHVNLLSQIVDQIDRFQSIDEMLEKFDMLYDSYEDILSTLKGYNEELSDVRRTLLTTIERKQNQISVFNSRIRELQQHLDDVQQRIDKINIEISSYRHLALERLTEVGAVKLAVESLYDLVRRYSRFSKSNEIEECTDANKCLFLKLRSIDTFMSDLTYYVHYVEKHGQQVVLTKLHYALSENAPNVLENVHMNVIDNDISNNKADWHGSCHTRRDRSATYKKLQESIEHDRCATKKQIQQPYYSFEAHGQDGVLYTIQINRFKKSEVRKSRLTRTSVMSSSSSRATINEKQQSMTTQISSKQRKEQGSIGQFRSLRQSYYDQSIPPWIEKKSGEHRSRKSTKHSTNRSSINAIVKSRMSNDLSKRQAMIIGPTTSTTVHSEVLTSNNKHIIQTLSITDPILVSQALTKSRLVIKTLLDDFSAKNVQRLLSVDEYPDLNITDMIKTST